MGGAAHEVAATLNALEGKLRELERELLRGGEPVPAAEPAAEHATGQGRAQPPPPPPPVAPPSGPAPRAATAASPVPLSDPLAELVAFRDLLERSADTLIAEYQRLLDRLRTGALASASAPERLFQGQVEIVAGPFQDVASLLAFERAVVAIPAARSGRVNSYDGRTARMHALLGEPVALVTELRRVSSLPFTVVEARSDALVLELSSGA